MVNNQRYMFKMSGLSFNRKLRAAHRRPGRSRACRGNRQATLFGPKDQRLERSGLTDRRTVNGGLDFHAHKVSQVSVDVSFGDRLMKGYFSI